MEQFTGSCSRFKQFETRLDKFWRNQDVMFDWTAEITVTGDRSEFKIRYYFRKYYLKLLLKSASITVSLLR